LTLFTHEHTVSSKMVHKGGIINLRVDALKSGNHETTREVVEHNGGVVILCQPQPDQVVLIKQYRYSINEELIEFPAGRIEKGESPLPAAQRELTEETGYIASQWREISRFFTAPGFCNEILYMYKASDVVLAEKSLDDDEETEVMLMTLTQAWNLVTSGQIRDGKTVAGLGLLLGESGHFKL
jgi:ADP-ribose pyrophosphatase